LGVEFRSAGALSAYLTTFAEAGREDAEPRWRAWMEQIERVTPFVEKVFEDVTGRRGC
jgi:hypothetical protein